MSELEIKNNSKTENPGFFSWLLGWLPRQRGLFLVFFILLISIPLTITVLLVVLPVLSTPLLPTEAMLKEQNADSTRLNSASNWDKTSLRLVAAREIEQKTQKNRLSLASKDSIYLLLNLNDSTLSVEIKGLTVHVARANDIFISRRITKASHDALLNWIEQPFTFQQELSTIAKTPVLVIDAPKDTTEAAQLPRKPLEPEKDYVQYSLLFDRQLLLEVKQSEEALPEDAELISNYRYRYDTTFSTSFLNKITDPLPSHRPVKISLTMPQADARTIFRAMPHSVYARLILIPPYKQ